jgi:hypothetical protein
MKTETKYWVCEICGKKLKPRGYASHYRWCKQKRDFPPDPPPPKPSKYFCKFCNSSWPTSIARNGHQIKCRLNPKREETIEKIRQSHLGLKHSAETKNKISSGMSKFWTSVKTSGKTLLDRFRIQGTHSDEGVDIFINDKDDSW